MSQRLKTLIHISILLILLPINIVSASEGNLPNWCYEGEFASEGPPFQLATIRGEPGTKIPFQTIYDNGNCPNLNPKICSVKRYLVPGNIVVKARDYQEFSCVWYRSKKGVKFGWVPASQLNIVLTSSQPSLQQWVGKWTDGNDKIDIQNSIRGFLKLKGEASWYGDNNLVNVGEFSALSIPHSNYMKVIQTKDGQYTENIDDEDAHCIVNLTLVGNYLVVGDNYNCGGLNVRFIGVYWRAKK